MEKDLEDDDGDIEHREEDKQRNVASLSEAFSPTLVKILVNDEDENGYSMDSKCAAMSWMAWLLGASVAANETEKA